MEYLPDEENKLVQAIPERNWEAAISFLQTEPQLVNTYNKIGQTPLMYAVLLRAPDNVLQRMIDAATKKTMEHENNMRRTILHYLAMFARVSSLRHALQKTNTKVNGKDSWGRTPLDLCLDYEYRRYEEHRETAICLLEYGAMLITETEMYDEVACREYGEKTRIQKKNKLRKSLLEFVVPAQILARGVDAIKAFNDEIQFGKITMVNSRVMFLGKEGVGKTSSVNAILGKTFNENEPSTDGIATKTAFQTVGEDCSKWEEYKDIDVCELTKQIREYNIAERIAKKLEPRESQETTSMSVSPSSSISPMETSEEATSLTAEETGTSDVSQSAATVSTIQFDRLPEEILKKVVANLDRQNPEPSSVKEPKLGRFKQFFMKITRRKSDKSPNDARFESVVENIPSDVTYIWDYAGQISYYITHRFFLTDGSSYVVVFSLFDPLNELAKSRDPLKDHFEMTNLQMIVFWMRSIYEHAVLQFNASTKLINDTIASPTISLVGTHKDKLEGSEEEKQNQIKAIFKVIFEEIEGMRFEPHVDRTMYAVDNTTANDKGIEELKKNLGRYTKQMAKTVPTKWVDFQSKIQEVGKTTLRMSLDEVTKIAVDCGIPNENTIHILNYLNDCGIILYSPNNVKLKNTVITNVHMLIEIFTKVITTEDKRPAMMKLWRLLDKGILSEALLRYLWKHELEEDKSNFDIFIELMKVFGLLFEKQKESEENNRAFIVPCLMSIVKGKNMEVQKDKKEMVSIYVTPTDFLPDAVYNILVVAFVDLMKEKGRSDDEKLFRNRSDFDFDDDHLVSLGAVKIKNMHALKLEITHRIEVGANDKQVISEPHPSVCMEVLNYLKHQLKTVYGTTEGIGYKLRVLCSVCQPTQQPHLHDLEDCLKKDKVSCGKMSMKTFRFKGLFSTEFVEEFKNFQTVQSLIIELGTRKIKEFFLKTTQQTSSSVVDFIKNEKQNGRFASMADFQGQDKMFSPDADISTFDIDILMTLIRYCCRFTYPDDIWEQPDKIDNPELANLIRIQQYKNTKLDRNTSCKIPAKDFDEEWKDIKGILLDLGVHFKDIEDIRLRKGFDKTAIQEMQNFQTIMLLIVALGTDVMRKYFLRVHNLKEGDVGQFLMSMKSSFTKVARLFKDQKNKMFTPNADINAFDISIMIKIIRYCHCGNPLPDSFWSQPDEKLDKELANFVRIQQYRNTKFAHIGNPRMTTKEFDVEWRNLTFIFQGVGVSVEEINQYKRLRLSI